jgi:deazaflavin-dependent oxidoreductase (nitroreductase family)
MPFVFPRFKPLNDLLTVSNRALYQASGGRIGNSFAGAPIYLLVTKGRKSGKERAMPLLFVEDGGNLVVVASNFGHENHPAWYLNLKADPNASVDKGKERIAVTAVEAEGSERRRLWERFAEVYEGYRTYEKRAGRHIPVVVLKPRDDTHKSEV